MEITYFQAAITGIIQGITELFPISSLGHAVLVPAWIGGSWKAFTTNPDSPYLAFTVALHLASAIALFLVFRKRWMELISGGINSLRGRSNVHSQVFWRIVVGTIPVVILGLVFEHKLRDLFAKPLASAIFITVNGLILFSAERLTKRAFELDKNEDEVLVHNISYPSIIGIGVAQSLALFSGISRFGITMSAGLIRKLTHPVASDFAFLLALPVILGAGVKKLPDLMSSQYHHLYGPILLGSLISFVATYISVNFLVRWFKTKTLYPFAAYCFVLGIISIIRFSA